MIAAVAISACPVTFDTDSIPPDAALPVVTPAPRLSDVEIEMPSSQPAGTPVLIRINASVEGDLRKPAAIALSLDGQAPFLAWRIWGPEFHMEIDWFGTSATETTIAVIPQSETWIGPRSVNLALFEIDDDSRFAGFPYLISTECLGVRLTDWEQRTINIARAPALPSKAPPDISAKIEHELGNATLLVRQVKSGTNTRMTARLRSVDAKLLARHMGSAVLELYGSDGEAFDIATCAAFATIESTSEDRTVWNLAWAVHCPCPETLMDLLAQGRVRAFIRTDPIRSIWGAFPQGQWQGMQRIGSVELIGARRDHD